MARSDSTIPRWYVPAGYGLVHGLLMALSLPPVGWWWCAFLALMPIALLGARQDLGRPIRVALWFGLGTLPYWLYLSAFVIDITWLGYTPMCVHLALDTALGVWAVTRVRRRFSIPMGLLLPVAWTGVEFLRGEVLWDGYPWALACHPLIAVEALAAPAAVGGQYFVLLLLAMSAGFAVDAALARTTRRRLGFVGCLLAQVGAWVGIGLGVPRAQEGGTVRVAVVQTNVPQDNKLAWTPDQEVADWQRFESLTAQAAQSRPDFIVWPETMMPGPTLEPAALDVLRREQIIYRLKPDLADPDRPNELPATEFADRLLWVQGQLGIPMVIGSEAVEGLRVLSTDRGVKFDSDRRYNSVYLVANARVAPQRYDKLHLTPFGEVMPYIEHWPWLQRRMLAFGAHGLAFNLSAGDRPVVLSVPSTSLGRPLRIATPICFEVTYPGLCRSLVFDRAERQADLMVNLTNDGWFGWWDAGRAQHLQIARWRCVELATPMVRAANTGVSAVIDASGRVLKAGVPAGMARVDGVLTAEVRTGVGVTPYARFGDIVGRMALVASGLVLLATILVPRKPAANARSA